MKKLKAVILAGGLGTRLRPFTQIIPKPLLPLGEKAILEIQIERLKKFGFSEIYLATNYKAEYIKNFLGDGSRYGVNIHLSKEEEPLGTAGPIKLIEKELDTPFLVMNGDILSMINFKDFYNFSISTKAPLTVTVKKIITPYSFGNIHFKGDFVNKVEEKPDIVNFALAGIYCMTPEIFEYIPSNKYFGMDSLINTLLKMKKPVAKYEILKYWLDIGRIDDYEKAQNEFNEYLNAEK